ncbi:MAG: TonB family protein [Marinoscillum sp.]|jgi:TonB family protein
MKKVLSILVMAIAIITIQSCAGKTDKKAESESTANIEQTKAERAAFWENERVERAELIRIELIKLAEQNPTYEDANGNLVYVVAEVDPVFNGGDKAMMKYIRDNLKFPEEALERGDEGTVFVDFIIGKTGMVRAVEITDFQSHGLDQSLQNEAMRVINSMPAWTPGSQNGEAVNVKFNIPITFQMI